MGFPTLLHYLKYPVFGNKKERKTCKETGVGWRGEKKQSVESVAEETQTLD